MLNTAFPCDSGGGSNPLKLPEFEYTGQNQTVLEEGVGWKIKFLTSGTFTLISPDALNIDVFLVGGGGGGGSWSSWSYKTTHDFYSGGGGGGGYTSTQALVVQSGIGYQIVIGAGGVGQTTVDRSLSANGTDGGSTSAFGFAAAGGKAGNGENLNGAAGAGGNNGGKAGRYRSSGERVYPTGGGSDGSGQGTTTREFSDLSGEDYAGGGGGGGISADGFSASMDGGSGGANGGGPGLNGSSSTTIGGKTPILGNTRQGGGGGNYGGGGGGAASEGGADAGGTGGQGICIIRNHREEKTV